MGNDMQTKTGKVDGCKTTQAARLVRAIRCSKRRGMTYGDLLALRISTSPWKRLSEAAHLYLKPHESLTRFKRERDGLTVFKIKRKAG